MGLLSCSLKLHQQSYMIGVLAASSILIGMASGKIAGAQHELQYLLVIAKLLEVDIDCTRLQT